MGLVEGLFVIGCDEGCMAVVASLRVVNHHLSKSLKGTVEDKLTIVSFAS
jgi:hypothetical protein